MNLSGDDRVAQLEAQLAHERAHRQRLENQVDQLQSRQHRHAVHSEKEAGAMQRSKSIMVPAMTDPADGQSMKRQRAVSHQGIAMSRSSSAQSDNTCPFRPTGPVTHLTASPAMRRYCSSGDEPANQSLQRIPPGLAVVPEQPPIPNIGTNPADWFKNTDWGYEPSQLTSSSGMGQFLATLSPPTLECPSITSGESGADFTSPLTRQNSAMEGGPFVGSAEMVAWPSSQSQRSDLYGSQGCLFSNMDFDSSSYDGKPPTTEHDLAYLGSALSTSLAAGSMERSISNTSATSATSTASKQAQRAKKVNQEVLQRINSTTLAPKPPKTPASTSSSRNGKEALPKTPYKRPKHPKVQCQICPDKPMFKGDHELRRHDNAKHKDTVKRFVCRDPAEAHLTSPVQPLVPLTDCKACIANKSYGAYYNAAAHLRRAHFNPKSPRAPNSRGRPSTKRGGSTGGNWPTMEVVKMWYKETWEARDTNNGAESAHDDAELDEADDGAEAETSGFYSQAWAGVGPATAFDPNVGGLAFGEQQQASNAELMGVPPVMAMPLDASPHSASFDCPSQTDSSFMAAWNTIPDTTASTCGSTVSSVSTVTPSFLRDVTQFQVTR